MEGAQKRCFTEDISIATKVIVTYTALQGSGEAPVSIKATAHDGTVVHVQDHITTGKFTFNSPNSVPGLSKEELESTKDDIELERKLQRLRPDGLGDNSLRYIFCFEQRLAGHHMPSLHSQAKPTRRVILNVKFGTDARTQEYYETLAKEKHLSTTEQLFKAIEDQVSDVVRDIDEMRTRERHMVDLNKHTSALVLWYSVSACLIVVGAAAISSFATQSFLSKRNLLKSAMGGKF